MIYMFNLFVVDALKCWRCSSDASTSAFCDDPFDPSIINEQQRRWAYVDCSFPPAQQPFGSVGQSSRPVCKKMKQLSKYSYYYINNLIKHCDMKLL